MSEETETEIIDGENAVDEGNEEETSSDPVTREEFEEMRNALKEATRKEREARKAAEKQLKEFQVKDETDTDRIAREAAEAAASNFKGHLVKAEAKAQLLALGLTASPERFLKMVDLESIVIDDDGSIEGLEDQIQGIREEFPEVFRKKPAGTPDAGKQRTESPAKQEPKSAAERVAQFAIGRH